MTFHMTDAITGEHLNRARRTSFVGAGTVFTSRLEQWTL